MICGTYTSRHAEHTQKEQGCFPSSWTGCAIGRTQEIAAKQASPIF